MSAAGLNRIEEARRALRYAWRGLIKSPWFTGVAVLTTRPLGRGPARALARAGVRPARPVRQLLMTRPGVAR